MNAITLSFVVSVFKHALVFAFAFGLAGVIFISLLVAFAPQPEPEQQFVVELVAWMFRVYAGLIGAVLGAIVGAVYSLLPKRSRDVWMAMALSAAAVLTPLVVMGLSSAYPLGWTLGVAALAAMTGAASAWLTRKISG